MNYKGLTLQGYSIPDPESENPSGLRTCGTIELGNMCLYKGKVADFGDDLAYIRRFGYPKMEPPNVGFGPKTNAANIIFCVTNEILTGNSSSIFAIFLLNHPHTHIIYAYKNDAHGPNVVYVCMNHRNLPEGFVHNIDEYRKKLRYKDCQYYVE